MSKPMKREKINRKQFFVMIKASALIMVPGIYEACSSSSKDLLSPEKHDVNVKVIFSEAMNKASVEAHSRLVVLESDVVPVNVDWPTDSTAVLHFGKFNTDDVSQFRIDTGAIDLEGNILDPFIKNFDAIKDK